MKKFFQKQRETILVLVYIGVITMFVFFVISPLLLKIKIVNDQIQEGNMKQKIIEQQMNNLPKIQQQYDALQESENSVDILLDKNKAVVLIERLEKLAQDSSNKIEILIQNPQLQKSNTVVTSKTIVDNSLITSLPSTDYLQMQIVLTGDYNKIFNFVSGLESIEYYSDITGIKIKQNDPVADTGISNPFNSTFNSQKIADEYNPENMLATLDVVFYTKK